MEIRVLRYFLETAREGNMSRAAERLHISQPTISKQLKELEEELGAELFVRSNYSIRLTEAGMRLRDRAADIVSLSDKTLEEFRANRLLVSGDVSVGSAESESFRFFADVVKKVQAEYPGIRLNIYSGNIDDVTERLDKGLLDFAIVMSFVDLNKYDYIKMPSGDTWGVIMLKDSPLSAKKEIYLEDLFSLPLICSRQWLEQDAPHWFGTEYEKINCVATFNLFYNAAIMVKAGIGYAISYDRLTDTGEGSELCFRPFKDVATSEMYVIWRKYQTFTPAAKLIIEQMQKNFIGK